jgi:Tol biopolymer transport system component/DNA-binding winged helix-turn-helix (wHTH) protein
LKQATSSSRSIRFGPFEANLRTEELRRDGVRIKLPQQSFRVLALLLERPGELVTREEIQTRLWRDGTVVEFENGINAAVRRLRRALRDSAEKPRYVETLARLGYRFIAVPVESAEGRSRGEAKASGATMLSAPAAATVTEIGARDYALAPVPKREPAEPRPFLLPRPRRPGWRTKLAAAIAGLVVIALTVWTFGVNRPSAVMIRTSQITRSGRIQVDSPIASDGKRLYLVERTGGHFQLASVNINGGTLQPVSTPFQDTEIFSMSPDGTQLLVGNMEGMPGEAPLWLLPVMDGSPRRLGDITAHSAAFSWDGRHLAFANGSTLYLANADGSGVRPLLNVDGTPGEMFWSPDGRFLRFTVDRSNSGRVFLWEVSTETGASRALLPGWRGAPTRWADGDSGGTWVQNGKYFIFRSARDDVSGIWAIREASGLLPWSNHPFQIYQGPLYFLEMLAVEDGSRVYFVGDDQRYELMRYDTGSQTFMPYLGGASAESVSYSRDGNWIAYIALPDQTLWRSRPDGSQRQQLTFAPDQAAYPQWSPDGSQIAFELRQDGRQRIALIASGGGTPRVVAPGAQEDFIPSWAPDANSLMFFRRHSGISSIYSLNLKSGELSTLPDSSGFKNPAVSPDGQYVAALTDDDRRVMLFDVRARKWAQLAVATVVHGTLWSRDSRSLYYQDVFGSLKQPIYRIEVSTQKITKVADISRFLRSDVRNYSFTGLAPDNSCIVRITRTNSDAYAVDFKLE